MLHKGECSFLWKNPVVTCMSMHWPCLYNFYLHLKKSGIPSISCLLCSSFSISPLPNITEILPSACVSKCCLWPSSSAICCLSMFNPVLNRLYFFITCKIKAPHHKCFIFTVLPAKSCTVKQIKQMADLNVKDRKKKSMKKSWDKLEYRVEYFEMWWIKG